eukprot:c32342_g1_i1.p2 GENE.c32342_g1_i1~~c32342_g1_i1.p2  ORF type:complete len:351 (+),score=92.61 c32342_g1_i1:34-1086(+)
MAAAVTEKICVLGSGNWGSVAAKMVASNATRLPHVDNEVKMWTFEELVDGRKITEIINTEHVNVKYLPGKRLPDNVIADPDAVNTVKDASLIVFCLPHQFLPRLLASIKPHIKAGARAITLIKGFDVDENGIVVLSKYISAQLGIPCDSLMGANVADEVAAEQFAEATVGSSDAATGALWQSLFNTPYFLVNVVDDPIGVELCGALKNVVALGAGFCDGLGFGNNTKAAIMRIGLAEMRKFTMTFFEGAGRMETYFESCGLADLITTCYGGRNRKCAAEFAKGGKTWEELETEILNGQKLQGVLTAKETEKAIVKAGLQAEFPLFHVIYRIAFEGLPASELFANLNRSAL